MGRLKEAEESFRAGLNLREQLATEFPTVPLYRSQVVGCHVDLANILLKTGRLKAAEEGMRWALAVYQQYTADSPTAENRWILAWAYNRQGSFLCGAGRPKEAEQAYRTELAISRQLVAEFPAVLLYRKSLAINFNNLGDALQQQGRLDEAVAQFQEAIRLEKDHALVHANLGRALLAKGRGGEAIAEFRKALKNDLVAAYNAHFHLGNALLGKGQPDEAIAEFREAIRLKKDFAEAHCNLGIVLRAKGQLDEAIAALSEAIRLKTDFDLARNELRKVEWLVRLEGSLPRILEGDEQPKDAADRLAYAWLCQQTSKKRYVAAARFYSEAFTENSQLADDPNTSNRYNASCAAALAGCGQGVDADQLDAKESARLRQQSLEWLRADLKAYRQAMGKSAGKNVLAIAQQMQHWLQDEDFTGVRGAESLAKLPAEERAVWQKLWADAAELLAKAQGKTISEKSRTPNCRGAISRAHSG